MLVKWVSFLDSVFSAGGGRGSVEAWYAAALDIEEVLTGAADSHVPFFVADVIKSFDTVDREILDRVLSSLGFPAAFRLLILNTTSMFVYSLSLATGIGENWTRDGRIPQECPLSMMFIVA